MNEDLLVYLILVPLYMIGFVIVGIRGHWKKRLWVPASSGLDEAFASGMISLASTSTGILERRDSTPQDSLQPPSSSPNGSMSYLRTTTQDFDTSERCPEVKKILKNIASILKIYSIPLLIVMDYISDISTAFFFLSQPNTRRLGIYSLLVIFAQRMISAIIMGENYGWETGVRQLFDLQVFHAVYASIKRERVVLQVMQIKILEGFLESFPQLLFQSYYLVKPSKHAEETPIVHISIILSLLSLSKAWMSSDEVAVRRDGFCCMHAEISEASDIPSESEDANDTFDWGILLWPIRMTVIMAWRFGEVVVSVTIIVGAANVISARGTVIGCFFLLLNAYFIQSMYPQTRKSSWFHYAIQKNRLQLAMEIKSCKSNQESSDCSPKARAEVTNDKNWACGKILRLLTILTVLYFAELNYFFWALPTFRPRSFVIVYYLWKITLLISLFTACVVSEARGLFMIFDSLLWYFYSGLFCFVLGGIITYLIAIDNEQYAKAIEADPLFLLEIIDKREFIFIERVMRSGVCSAHRLIEDAIAWMVENNIDPNDEEAIRNFVEDQPYCKLLYYLIKYHFVETGSSVKKKLNVEDPNVYRSYAVPALVYKCNFSRKKTLRSQLARTILLKLVTKRRFAGGYKTLSSFEAIMEAGASLHFVRYHLDAPEVFFQKGGRFNCTAQQLHDNEFDLLFCLRADFTTEDLILAGFNVSMLNNELVLECNENGESFEELEKLRRLKKAGFTDFFYLKFTPDDLLSTNIFSAQEILQYGNASLNCSQSVYRYSEFTYDFPLQRLSEGVDIKSATSL